MSLPLCAAALLLPAALFLVQLAIVSGQYQTHGAKKHYLLVEVPGVNSTKLQSYTFNGTALVAPDFLKIT